MAATSAAPASAYLHVANAQSACGSQMWQYADASFANQGQGRARVWTNGPWYHRDSDTSVKVHAAFKSSTSWQEEVRCWVVGNDGSEGIAFSGGYPWWTFNGFDNYPYTSCPGYVWNAWCFHDPGFS